MSFFSQVKKSKRHYPPTQSVLNLPPKNALMEVPSQSNDYALFHHSKQKMNITASNIRIEKSKLFTDLQTYEWRHQTQFPIVKTHFISVKSQKIQHSHTIELQVFNEHCPIRLKHIYEMGLGQTLYLLKQAIIGFERLFDRFGGFQITQSMVAINQKGFCRVWLNENFALNSFPKSQISQPKMIYKIITLIEGHSTESKSSKKLFQILKYTKTFLTTLRTLQLFAQTSRVLVPGRFVFLSSLKQIPQPIPEFSNINRQPSRKLSSNPCIRHSIRSNNLFKPIQSSHEQLVSISKSSRKLSTSPSQIKRFKSQDKLRQVSMLKVSDGETTHSKNHIKTSGFGQTGGPRDYIHQQSRTNRSISRKKGNKKFLEKSSFIMGMEIQEKVKQKEKQKQKKVKKQLSYSQAFQNEGKNLGFKQNRKYSANLVTKKGENPYYRFYTGIKKSQQTGYMAEFSSILDNDQKISICTPRDQIIQEEDERVREEHTQHILKSNGWSNFHGFMEAPKQMKESFHEGEEVNNIYKDVKLEKLSSIGKRKVAMSILPEEYEQN